MAAAAPQPQNSGDYRKKIATNSRSNQIGNVRREEKRSTGTYIQQELPTNASTDEIFNASYQNQGLQPQNLGNETQNGEESENINSRQSNYQSRENNRKRKIYQVQNKPNLNNPNKRNSRRRSGKKMKTLVAPKVLVGKSLAKARVSTANGPLFLIGTKLWFFVQLPLAIAYLVLGILYLANDYSILASFLIDESLVLSFFIINGIVLHLLGILTLTIICTIYMAALLKPLSGKQSMLKYGAIVIALLGYSAPILSLFPFGLLLMGVVWLYPE